MKVKSANTAFITDTQFWVYFSVRYLSVWIYILATSKFCDQNSAKMYKIYHIGKTHDVKYWVIAYSLVTIAPFLTVTLT